MCGSIVSDFLFKNVEQRGLEGQRADFLPAQEVWSLFLWVFVSVSVFCFWDSTYKWGHSVLVLKCQGPAKLWVDAQSLLFINDNVPSAPVSSPSSLSPFHFSFVDVFLAVLEPTELTFITEPSHSLLLFPEAYPQQPLGWLLCLLQCLVKCSLLRGLSLTTICKKAVLSSLPNLVLNCP